MRRIFQPGAYRNIVLMWALWFVGLVAFQGLVSARLGLIRPDHALFWTADETMAHSQRGKPTLLDPFMNAHVAWDSEFYLSIALNGYDDAAVRAIGLDAAGGRAYNTANDYDVTLAAFLRLAGEGLQREIRLVGVPVWLLRLVVPPAMRLRAALRSGSEPVSASASLDFIASDNPFTSRRARDELGWNPPVRPEVGVPDAFRWWKEQAR